MPFSAPATMLDENVRNTENTVLLERAIALYELGAMGERGSILPQLSLLQAMAFFELKQLTPTF